MYKEAQNQADSSPESTTDLEAQNVVSADSPTAVSEGTTPEAEPKPKSLLDAVKGALKERTDASTDSKAEGSADSQTAVVEGEPKDAVKDGEQEADNDEFPGGSEKSKQRWNKLLDERKTYQGKAQQWDQFSEFARSSSLNAEELTNTLNIARLVKQDPHEALSILRSLVGDIEKQTGATAETLPNDLQSKVERGLIDEESAIEIATERTRRQMAAERNRDQQAQQEAQQSANQQAQFVAAVSSAVSDLERRLESSDPDYSRIKGLVKDKVIALIQMEGGPESPEAAVKQVKLAVEQVKKDLSGFMPQRQQTRVVTGGNSTPTVARPKTALEAAKLALHGQQPRY